MTKDQWRITWIDSGREPQVAPNPRFPEGVDLDVSAGRQPTCTVALPYPARRIGYYVIDCRRCRLRSGCTTAGRPDDPRAMTMACQSKGVA